jgi:3-methyladenine DNA glycosylase AlkD
MTITREEFYEAFAQAWIDARPWWDVLDTQFASALAKRLGLEDGTNE